MTPRLRALLPFVGLAVVLGLTPLVAPTSVVNVGVFALIYALAAIGLSLLMGLAGQVSLGHAAFFAVGGYTQAVLVTKAGVPMLLALPVSMVAAMVVALLVGLPLLRLRGYFLALATMGLGIIVAVVLRESDDLGSTSGIYGIAKPTFGGRVYDTPAEFFWLMTPVVLVGLFLAANLVRSRTGRALSAVNDSEVAAECLGVDTFALRLRVFVLAGGYAGLAGALYAHWVSVVSPEISGFALSVRMLLIVVLGGLGSVWGAIIGAVGVEVLDEGLRTVIPAVIPGASGEVELLGFGVVLVLLVLLLPGGLTQIWRGVRRRRSRGEEVTPEAAAALATVGDEAALTALLRQADLARPGEVILSVRDLTKRYGGVRALSALSLDVHAGEILAVIGPNGAGKTTAFNIITGVIPPTSGTVTTGGREVQGKRPHVIAGLGATRTFQNLQVFGSTTVLGNVVVARHLRSRSGVVRGMLGLARGEQREVEASARTALAAMGLSAEADRAVVDLSFAQQRQVEVARALALSPRLLLLDEPMAGLSTTSREALSDLMRHIRASGVSILLVEHDVAAVMALADRVAVLDDGILIALGTPDVVANDPVVVAAYLGTDDAASALIHSVHMEGP
jgi:branched-chain amino acid transport system permease protein